MRKIFYLLSLTFFAFISCSKENGSAPENKAEQLLHGAWQLDNAVMADILCDDHELADQLRLSILKEYSLGVFPNHSLNMLEFSATNKTADFILEGDMICTGNYSVKNNVLTISYKGQPVLQGGLKVREDEFFLSLDFTDAYKTYYPSVEKLIIDYKYIKNRKYPPQPAIICDYSHAIFEYLGTYYQEDIHLYSAKLSNSHGEELNFNFIILDDEWYDPHSEFGVSLTFGGQVGNDISYPELKLLKNNSLIWPETGYMDMNIKCVEEKSFIEGNLAAYADVDSGETRGTFVKFKFEGEIEYVGEVIREL